MGHDAFEVTVNVAKLLIIFLMMIQMVPLLVWVERRGSAFIQHRFGPNRVGPLGLLQLAADAVKFIMKEQFAPSKSHRLIYYAAPIAALVPPALALASIPLAPPIALGVFEMFGQTFGPYTFDVQGVHLHIGIIYILGVGSLGAYGILMAGWGSSNKFSMMGALRASAQMISYELAMGLSIVGVVLLYGTVDLREIITAQAGSLVYSFGNESLNLPLPNWGVFYQPIGFILFMAAAFAETNRLPFDLAEAEGELVVGFHTEYGGFKMLMFFMGEYGHMMVASGLLAIFFFGGYHIPYISAEQLHHFFMEKTGSENATALLTSGTYLVSMVVKMALFLWIYIWVRWTLPRFKYDRLMDLGWKTMLPWALANIVITATVIFLANALKG